METYKLLYGKDRRLGVFIHFGLYSLTEYHEQTLLRTDIGREAYEQLIHRFNPVRFNAETWALLAKEAGMSYICLTTKHCDGFCLWDTKATDYNVMHSPFGRDIVKEFSLACQKHGLGLAFYYSNPDWHHPNSYNPKSTHQMPPRPCDEPDTVRYREYEKQQVTELLTNYGPICGFFWDIPTHIEDRSMNELVRKLQPGIRINDRGWDEGDFSTPEREVPGGAFTRLTEACQSVGRQSWGYRKNEDYYTLRFLEASIDSVLSKGGNYLLNVGPMADGSVPARGEAMVRSIGHWYAKVKEAYDGDAPTPLFAGEKQFTATRSENNLYLHFNAPPEADGIALYPVNILPEEAVLLNTGAAVTAALDVMPTLYQLPRGKQPCLHIYNLPFDELAGQVPILRLTFWDMAAVEACFDTTETKEARL